MEYILWIVIAASFGTSQQAALFPTEAACENAKGVMMGKLQNTRAQRPYYVIAECLPRGEVPKHEGVSK